MLNLAYESSSSSTQQTHQEFVVIRFDRSRIDRRFVVDAGRLGRGNGMKGKRRTPLPRPPSRKRKPRTKPVSPRAKGNVERLAVRRRAAMQYRLAGASYRSIAAKLTEELGQRVCRRARDQRRAGHEAVAARLDTHGLGRRDSGVGGTAARDGAAARGPDGARERPGGSGVLEGAVAVREWPRAGWPTGSRDEGTAVPFRCRIVAGTRPAASRCRGTRRTLRTRGRVRS